MNGRATTGVADLAHRNGARRGAAGLARAAWLAALAALLLATVPAAAGAQGVAWLRETQGLSRADIDLHWETLQSACRDQPDGGTQSWSNDRTGHHGSVTVVATLEYQGMHCRKVATTLTTEKTVRAVHRMCLQPGPDAGPGPDDGIWKFAD